MQVQAGAKVDQCTVFVYHRISRHSSGPESGLRVFELKRFEHLRRHTWNSLEFNYIKESSVALLLILLGWEHAGKTMNSAIQLTTRGGNNREPGRCAELTSYPSASR